MLSSLLSRYPIRIHFYTSFGFGQSLGQVSVSVSAETQNYSFGRSLENSKICDGAIDCKTNKDEALCPDGTLYFIKFLNNSNF